MKKLKVLLAVFLVFFIISGCTKVEEERPIRIALNMWPGYAYTFIAREKGFFKKNYVEVDLVLRKNITESTRLFKNKEVDGVFSVFPDVIKFNAEGILSKIVYIADRSNEGDVIIGRPELNSLTDLKGKTISFEGVNTFSHLFVVMALESAGLKETDVLFENVPAMDVLTALEDGRIDAGHTWEPVTTHALANGSKVLARAEDIPNIIMDVLAFHEKVIEERPDDIQQIVKSLFEARDFVFSNMDKSIEIMARNVGISLDEMKRGINGACLLDLNENIKAMEDSNSKDSLYTLGKYIIDFYFNRGQLSQVPGIDNIIELKFVNNISRIVKEDNLN